MKKILFLIILSVSFYCNGQSITLSPSATYPLSVKTGGSGAGFYGDISTMETYGTQLFYVNGTTSSLGTYVGNLNTIATKFSMNGVTNLSLQTGGTDRLFILPSGKVGIGTPTPVSNLDVLGTDNWNLGGGSNGDFRVGTNSYNFRIGVAQGGGGAGTVRLYGNVLILGGNGLDKVIITSNGLGVGGNFPTYALECKTNSSIKGFGNYSSDNLKYWEQFTSTGGGLYLYANGSYRGFFDPTSGVYTSSSDKNFKKNIASLNNVLDKVNNLQPSTYEYIENNPSNRKSIGFIAQDLETHFPEFVYKNTDEKTGKEVYSVDYAGMSVIALKAIQEQQAMIKELQAEIAKLKNK